MLGLLKKSNNGYHQFTSEEITQVKMLDLRELMKEKGVHLSWIHGQYEGKCPFHEDPKRSPRLFVNQDKGVWLWRCDGGHHGGDTIKFAEASEGMSFPRAVEVLRKMIIQVPKLNGNGSSIKDILKPMMDESIVSAIGGSALGGNSPQTTEESHSYLRHTTGAQAASPIQGEEMSAGFIERSDDSATFKYGDLIYHTKDLKNARANSLKIILKLIYKDSQFTDRVDLHSARGRKSFANQASDRLSLQSAQIEEHLESLMENLETVTRRESPVTSQKEEINEKEKQEALDLLLDPNLLNRMASDLDKLGYVGEETNKKILYLVATSRLLDKPISAIIRSGSGAGKSALMEQVLSLMPEEDVLFFSRITPQSLFYMGKEALDRKVLAIDEREGSQSADYSIRTLQSRGKLTLAASQKDPRSGEWRTLVREFAARTPYMESSTKEKINEENLNRCFELYLDESPDQTKRILEAQRKAAAGIDLLSEEEKTKLRKIYQNAQKLLRPIEVKVPYELDMELPATWLRTRRDHERFISLIKAIALIYQHQREGEGALEATRQDYELAKGLAQTVMGNVLNELPRPLAQFYDLLKKKIEEKANGLIVEDYAFTKRQVRVWLGLPDHIVKKYMKALEDLEYVQIKRSIRGSRHYYWLVDCLLGGINIGKSARVGQPKNSLNPDKS